MDLFNKGLNQFLTLCREKALEELNGNQSYAESKEKQKSLRAELETLISPDKIKVLTAYVESYGETQGMEYDTILLCGITVSAEIQKRFDTSTDEYKAFAEEILQ